MFRFTIVNSSNTIIVVGVDIALTCKQRLKMACTHNNKQLDVPLHVAPAVRKVQAVQTILSQQHEVRRLPHIRRDQKKPGKAGFQKTY